MRRCRPALAAARSGAVAVAFAIMAAPLCMLAGLVINFGWALQAKSQLDLAADAAAMAAARTAAAGYAAGQRSATYKAEATAAANQWWSSQAGAVAGTKSFSASPSISQNGQTLTATITYSATVAQVMPGLFGAGPNGTTAIANTVGASITVHAYVTLDFLLDNTSSMMLPATDADLLILQTALQKWLANSSNAALVNASANYLVGWNSSNNGSYQTWNLPLPAVGNYCAFACHWTSGSSASNQTDYYGVARAAGETLRFDVVQSATQTAIQQMETSEQVSGQLSLGIFAFGGPSATASSYLTTIYPEGPIDTVSNNVTHKDAGAAAAIAAMQSLTPPVSGDVANTNIGTALTDTLDITGQAGDGSTSASPRKALILVTDGLEDDTPAQVIPTTEGPIDPSICNAMKDANYTIYVLYTPYGSSPVYLPDNIALQPYLTGAASPSVLSALQSCASSASDVIEATSPSEIASAMVTLTNQAVGSATRVLN